MQLRRRYPSLYIPSDFTEAVIEWPVTTPIVTPLSLSITPITFNVLHKEVDCPDKKLPPVFAPDADSRYSAKVSLFFELLFIIIIFSFDCELSRKFFYLLILLECY